MTRNLSRYNSRRRTSAFVMAMCWVAAAAVISVLFIILTMLVARGASALSLHLFTHDVPPPGESGGGLRNAIVGSLILTSLGILIGTPIGILAGTYLSEYGRFSPLAAIVRFVNNILLSAPSIVIGLFVYTVMVRPMGHFSGVAGAASLAILVIPIVVRTTENMLLLVPDQLREAVYATGAPRILVIRYVAYRAAKAGIVTGVLLAVARISGETAPLLFTALNNQFFSIDVNAPMASLSAVVFQFALSPYTEWQNLAWSGALIITAGVLVISILARWLGSRGEA